MKMKPCLTVAFVAVSLFAVSGDRLTAFVNNSKQELSLEEWKARALAAENKLDRLRRATAALLKEF